ncbi:hypothetical protein [Azotobacter chroococcum]|uniref:hypothetical protein n=1 Tax=Azotobacter chroococcum TaxID=353 RepID=UPI00130E2C04|nr:hypothetical protein [Azotobacter chroococcum]
MNYSEHSPARQTHKHPKTCIFLHKNNDQPSPLHQLTEKAPGSAGGYLLYENAP